MESKKPLWMNYKTITVTLKMTIITNHSNSMLVMIQEKHQYLESQKGNKRKT